MKTTRARRVAALPLLSISFALAACSVAGGDATDDQSQATHITPDGSDLPGSLKVVAPNGAPASQVSVSGLGGALGDELTPLSVGSHDVHLTTSDGVMATGSATVASDTLTTVQAAVVGVTLTGSPTTLGLAGDTGANVYDPATSGIG